MKRIAVAICIAALSVSCAEDDEKKQVKVNTKLRSTGSVAGAFLTQAAVRSLTSATLNTQTASSQVDLEYFKVPIARINLTYGDTGSGYTGASPDLYSCTGDDEACAVDLLDDSLDNILTGSTSQTFDTESDQEYTGVSVEHCNEAGEDSVYRMFLKGTVVINGATYYTNAEDGLSLTAPAEEAAISTSCTGSNSDLLAPITISADSEVNVVFYADPSANVFATDNKDLGNSSCLGEGISLCSNKVMIFGTVDSAKPTVERYLLATDGDFSDAFVTMLLNQEDQPFGVLMTETFADREETKMLHSPSLSLDEITETAAGTYDFTFNGETVIAGFERAAHSGTISGLVDTPATYTASKL